MVKNCDLGLENAALGLRPRAVFSRPRSQFFKNCGCGNLSTLEMLVVIISLLISSFVTSGTILPINTRGTTFLINIVCIVIFTGEAQV